MSRPVAPYLSHEHPIRFAHRGSRILWPENTMAAFEGAVDLGYRYIETDVRITRDRQVVVFHDATLERTTNGVGKVVDWPWEDLRVLDAGWSFEEAGDHPWRGRGEGISRLADVLAAFPDVCFNIDLKGPGLEWPVAEVVRAAGREESVLVGSFVGHRTARFRRITGGRVATAAGRSNVSAVWSASRLGRRVHVSADAFQVPHDHRLLRIDAIYVDAIHAAGAQIHCWTVNEPDDMQRLLALGVDGIVTDRPDLLNQVLFPQSGG